jgi:hypothetical protein
MKRIFDNISSDDSKKSENRLYGEDYGDNTGYIEIQNIVSNTINHISFNLKIDNDEVKLIDCKVALLSKDNIKFDTEKFYIIFNEIPKKIKNKFRDVMVDSWSEREFHRRYEKPDSYYN